MGYLERGEGGKKKGLASIITCSFFKKRGNQVTYGPILLTLTIAYKYHVTE
jgi:hypothetical protein